MTSPIYRFGDFRLEPATRKLWRGDEEFSLPPRVFNCLVYLVEHRERAVKRDELIAAVWGDVHLSDKVLDQTILRVRRALDDEAGQEQPLIETVRGFGYRWAAPVESEEGPIAAGKDSSRRAAWLGILLAILGIGALVVGTTYLRHSTHAGNSEPAVSPRGEGDIALLLPVTVEADESFAWVRLGLMDLIAQRLRAAGQPMVPSDTVIALVRGHSGELGPDELERLTATTGARLVLRADAEATDARWHVSLHTLAGAQPPITTLGEAEDVLDAARIAADRMALSLGRTPVPDSAMEPGLTTLLQRVEAARLAQQHDVVRALIETTDPELRQNPEVRFQLARIELSGHDLDAARTVCESLLTEVPAERDPVLRARILLLLGSVYIRRADLDAADRVLEEAADLLEHGDNPSQLGRVLSTLGVVALKRGDFDTARLHFAHARTALAGTGDVLSLAALDNHQGLLETLRERYAEALSYFEGAVEWAATTHDLGDELGNLANVLYLHLGLLDTQAAAAVEPRVQELLQQTTSPWITAWANLTRAYLLESNGQHEASETLLTEVLSTTGARDDLHLLHLEALVLRAEQAARQGDPGLARRVAGEVVDQVPPDYAPLAEQRGRAWLILIRSHLNQGRSAAAAEASAVLADWARRTQAPSIQIYTALAQAEVAAANGQSEAAESAFEQALTLADTSQVPLRSLQVAESYVSWLLADEPPRAPDPERALVVASHVAKYANRHYGAALLQLRATHAVGASAAWRGALASARSLAGERQIPPRLEIPTP